MAPKNQNDVTFTCSYGRCTKSVTTDKNHILARLQICAACQDIRFAAGEKLKREAEAQEANGGR